jgi:hypothetical protein
LKHNFLVRVIQKKMANIGVLINQPYWHDYVDITINDVLKDNYNPDDKKIPCIILQVKKNENKLLSIYQQGKGQKTGSNAAATTSHYDRLVLFGFRDSTSGGCFAMIFQSSEASSAFFKRFNGVSISKMVGATGYLLEPRYYRKTLTQDSNLPLFETKKAFESFQFENAVPVPLIVDNLTPGDTLFFQLVGVRVLLESVCVQMSKCSGVQCDRLLLPATCTHCCCFQQKVANSVITLNAVVIAQNLDTDEVILKSEFQSWAFTNLCMIITHDSALSSYTEHNERPMRVQIGEVIRYVNQHGGWDITGWARKGKVLDASDQTEGVRNRLSEDIASDHVNPHIVNLVPHNNTQEVKDGVIARRF